MKYYKVNCKKIVFITTLIAFLSSCNIKVKKSAYFKDLHIEIAENGSDKMEKMSSILAIRIAERSEVRVVKRSKNAVSVKLVLFPGVGAEGFKIEDGENGSIKIIGNDERGLLYGIGKFLRTSTYHKEGFEPSKWRGTSVPEKPVRGIYFATHFYNYYQNAPVEEVERYIEDLGLWGVNHLMFWYDMHHFSGMDDPDAQKMAQKLKRLALYTKKLGLGVGFTMIGNEGYANSPNILRAEPGGHRGGNYPEVICPNKPGGLDYILKIKSEFFNWVGEIQPEYICIWPYDQGGCGSFDCEPWGSNGFLKCAMAIANLAKIQLPNSKIILSTWMFDKIEWDGLKNQLENNQKWVDLIMAEKIDETYKGIFSDVSNIPIIGFPEISMYNSFPWGGFGANPLPQHIAQQWGLTNNVSGGFPYSEGIFDDINKIVCTQLYWKSDQNQDEILREYISYEFGMADTDSVLGVIQTLEQNHHWRWWPGKLEGVKLQLDWYPSKNARPQADPGAEKAYEIVKQTNIKMPSWARESWRWRILFVRTMLDAELKLNGGSPTQTCLDGFSELMRLYHVTEKTDPVVKPPLPSM